MTTTTGDYDEIVRVMQLYFDGMNENNLEKMKEAFHENAWIMYIDAEGTLHQRLICEGFEASLRENNPMTRTWLGNVVGRIISVTQVGDAAAVQLNFDHASDKSRGWVDFHNLLRINGVWKITNKTATHRARQTANST
jgi:hypothetical protein